MCLLQTALELIEEGKEIYVVADCVGSRRDFDRDIALARLRQEGARIVTREMVVFEWLGEAATHLFDEICRESEAVRNAARQGEQGPQAVSGWRPMNFIAVLAALGLEQWRAFRWRVRWNACSSLYVRASSRS